MADKFITELIVQTENKWNIFIFVVARPFADVKFASQALWRPDTTII